MGLNLVIPESQYCVKLREKSSQRKKKSLFVPNQVSLTLIRGSLNEMNNQLILQRAIRGHSLAKILLKVLSNRGKFGEGWNMPYLLRLFTREKRTYF